MPLPSGTVTFLFTDIEGSTKLWEQHPQAMAAALARHDTLLRQAVKSNNGFVFKTVGDAFCAAFSTASDALQAAVQSHLLLMEEEWGEIGSMRIRVALHTGQAHERDGDYFGPTLNRVARLQSTGYGQQTLLSQSTYALVRDSLPPSTSLLDLGLHHLKDLQRPEQVFQLNHPVLPSKFPPLKSLDYLPTNLPRQLTSFIGREQEMAEIESVLKSSPLVTLTGTGGTGKSRLALQVGADLLEEYKDGVWLVELAAIADPTLVPQSIATVLQLREEAGRPLLQTVEDYLRDRHLLLLVDNCEHLVSVCARVCETLLKACPQLTILATSREPLGIAGERSWRTPSLLTPDPDVLPREDKDLAVVLMNYDAPRLFVERAVTHRQDFVLRGTDASVVARLCQQLDGIPLAIELAAARVRSLSVEEINARLDDRFRLLTGGSQTALPRHQTLRAMIDWSYNLLTESEKTLFCRLSIFAGGWTLEAAEQVGSAKALGGGKGIEDWEVLDLLTSLVDKSLVVYQGREGKARYRLLETVRQYGRDRLIECGEHDAIRERHRDYFLVLAEEAERNLTGAEQAQWLHRLYEENENLRAALEASRSETGSEAGLRLCGALATFWRARGYLSEGRKWCEDALETIVGQARSQERAKVLSGAGLLAAAQADYPSAKTLYEESLAIFREVGDQKNSAYAIEGLGEVASYQGGYSSAKALYEESLDIRREIGDRNGIASSLNGLGNVAISLGDYPRAQALYEESLFILREIGGLHSIAVSLCNLGNVAHAQANYLRAQTLYEESLTIFREIGTRYTVASLLGNLGNVAHAQANYLLAQTLFDESLAIQRDLGDRYGIASSLNEMATVATAQANYPRAQHLYEESLTIQREIGNRYGIALSLNGLGCVADYQGDYPSAHAYFEESLGIFRKIGDRRGIAYSLEAFAGLAAKTVKTEQAATLWGSAKALREEIGAPLPHKEQERYDHDVAKLRETLGAEAFSTAWAEGLAMTQEQAIEYALEVAQGYIEPEPR